MHRFFLHAFLDTSKSPQTSVNTAYFFYTHTHIYKKEREERRKGKGRRK